MICNDSRQDVCVCHTRTSNPQCWNLSIAMSETSAKVTFWGVIIVVSVVMSTFAIIAFK